MDRLLPVFDNAKVNRRQFVVDKQWIENVHSFSEANERYFSYAKDLSIEAIDQCLANSTHLNGSMPYEAIDMVMFISSTGIATPSVDVHLLNERPFREDIVRMPLWGLGCAGGAMGLARATDWLKHHKDKTALVICCELCSLTFQKEDESTSNIVGTALFGDGVAATLMIGEHSPYRNLLQKNKLKINDSCSYTKKNSTNVMGWDVTKNGLEVIFSKKIPRLVSTLWKKHVADFLHEKGTSANHLSAIIAHPGGRKVLEEMEKAFSIDEKMLKHSYGVLKDHGNMSSATVIYVLKRWLEESIGKSFSGKQGILSALGPGFSSELLLMEWIES